MKIAKTTAAAILLLVFASCSGRDGSRKAEDIPLSGNDKEILLRIGEINESAPYSCDISFSLEASFKRRRYKLGGSYQFSKSEDRLYASVFDTIFKTPLAMLFAEGNTAAVYSPLQKKLYKYADASRGSGLRGTGLDFYLLRDLAGFKIPLLKNGKTKESSSSDDGRTAFIVLENNSGYESIFFEDGIPNKIVFSSKNSAQGDETEIRLSDSRLYGESLIPRKITVIKGNDRVDVGLDSVEINTPVAVKTLDDIKLPGNVSVYTR